MPPLPYVLLLLLAPQADDRAEGPGSAQETGAEETGAEETPAQEFLRLGRALYANDNPFVGAGRRTALEAALAQPDLPLERRVAGVIALSDELLKFAEIEPAIALLEETRETARAAGEEALVLRLTRQLGLAWLRQGEQANCVRRHNADCCLFPLEGGAVHTERAPAERARAEYGTVLAAAPDDLEARWLLNVTAMALGEFPDGVPERWRFPERAFASEAAFPRFRDVAAQVGLDVLAMAGGVAVEDFDGDGWLDVLTSTCDPLGPLRYFRNDGEGGFEERSEESHSSEQLGGLDLVSGDYDNDGDFDAVVLRGAWLYDWGRIRKSLLANEGGTFLDVTRAAGLAEPASPSQAGLFGDFDGDGWLDFYEGNESRAEFEKPVAYPSQLYRNTGDGRFENVTARAGVSNDRYAKGVAAGDYDNDGDLDLYVSNIGLNRLYRNRGDGTFRDVAVRAGVAGRIGADGKPERHFACWFWDLDNDGWLDLWVSGFQALVTDLAKRALGEPDRAVRPMCLRNRRDGTFEDVTVAVGADRPFLPMGANFGDLDNDGWLDVYLGTGEPALQALMPNVLLWNRGGERFLDVTTAAGMGHLQKGHGIAFADLDHDGDQDVLHQLGGFFPVDRFHMALFENPGFGNHWLTLELVGTECNRSAVGARLALLVETPEGPREIHRAAGCVSSFGGSPHRQEIGLGKATRIRRLEVRWPGAKEPQVFEDVPMDAFLRVTQGRAEPERLERGRVRF